MQRYISLASAGFAALAAVFWLLSASVTFPPFEMYWGAMPDTAPYAQAVARAGHLNWIAAGSAGIAAALQCLREVVDYLSS